MKNPITTTRLLLLAMVLAFGNSLSAQLTIASTDEQANTTTAGNQFNPATAQAGNGKTLVVWESDDQDGDGFGIFGQYFGADGLVSGAEFQINTSTAGDQVMANVAMDDAGNAIVVWMDQAADGSGWGLFGQRFDAAGTASGTEFAINSITAGSQRQPSVSMDHNGDFVVVWTGENGDADGFGIQARQFDATGTALATEFTVNDSIAGYQGYADVAMDSTGNFAIAWQSQDFDSDGNGIFAKMYDASGTVQASEFQVNATSTGNQQEPAVGLDNNGNAVIAWSSFDGASGLFQVDAARFDLTGTAINAEFTVNGSATEAHDHAHVAVTHEGKFAISYSAYGRDGSYHGIYIQAYDATATSDGSEELVNTEVNDFQQFSGSAWRLDSLPITLAWQSGLRSGSSTQDGDGYGIFTKQVGNIDTEAPVAVCQNITVYLDGNGAASIAAADVDGGSTDNVGIVTTTIDVSSFDCNSLGAQSVSLVVTDAKNNSDTCTATVTVLDVLAPVSVCQNLSLSLDANGSANLTAAQVGNGSSDNCNIASTSIDVSNFTCNDTGANAVVLTVTDGSGNLDSCTSTVTIEDNTAPTAICQDLALVFAANGSATLLAADLDNGSSDNCGISGMSIDQSEFDCSDIGSNIVSLTVNDASGNSSTCTATINVSESTAPTAVCKNVDLNLNSSGNASLSTSQVNNGSSDNCSIANLSLSKTSFSCNDLGTNTVTLTVSDASGNQSSCTANVIVNDIDAPTLSCLSNTTYSCIANVPSASVNDVTVSDNCDGNPNVVLNEINATSGNTYKRIRYFTAVDNSGNVSNCTQEVTVNVPTNMKSGSCSWCFAKVTMTPSASNPSLVTLSSCEKIKKVRLIDVNGTQFNMSVNTKTGIWIHPSGLPVKTVKVKSGCTNKNFSHTFNLCDGSSKAASDEEFAHFPAHLELKAYPNPTNGQIKIELTKEGGEDGESTIQVVDMNGKVLEVRKDIMTNGFQEAEFDLGQFSNGMYYIIVDHAGQRLTEKVIKQ